MGINNVRDHKGRKRIQVSKYWPDGSRFRRYVPNKTLAKTLLARIEGAISTADWKQLKDELSRRSGDKMPTVEEFSRVFLSEHCEVRNRRPEFHQQALVSVTRILGDVKLDEIGMHHAHKFVTTRRTKGLAPATVNRGIAVLKSMLSVAVEKALIPSNPLFGFKMLKEEQKVLRVMTVEEERRLVNSVSEVNETVGAMVALMGQTGLRLREALLLRKENVDLKGRLLGVAKSKSGRVRYIPLTDRAIRSLKKPVKLLGSPYCFVRLTTGKPYRDPRSPFEKGRRHAGLDWVGFHDLRHFRASQWVMRGVDLRTVQELLGHRDIKTTMRYAHFAPNHAQRAVAEAEKLELEELEQAKNRSMG